MGENRDLEAEEGDPSADEVAAEARTAVSRLRAVRHFNEGDAPYDSLSDQLYSNVEIPIDRAKLLRELSPLVAEETNSSVEVFELTISYMTEAFRRYAIAAHAGHSMVESRLLDDLASSSGKSVSEILSELDEWASEV